MICKDKYIIFIRHFQCIKVFIFLSPSRLSFRFMSAFGSFGIKDMSFMSFCSIVFLCLSASLHAAFSHGSLQRYLYLAGRLHPAVYGSVGCTPVVYGDDAERCGKRAEHLTASGQMRLDGNGAASRFGGHYAQHITRKPRGYTRCPSVAKALPEPLVTVCAAVGMNVEFARGHDAVDA